MVFTLLALALLSACNGSPPGNSPPDTLLTWPPAVPRHPERLTTPLAPGADPAIWWNATFFTPLPPAVYQDDFTAQIARTLILQTNETRADNGVGAVIEDQLLNRVATAHARDEALRDYWNHKSPEGLGSRDRVRAAGGSLVTAGGENSQVLGVLNSASAREVVTSFLNHAGHRELLLHSEVQHIGIGIWQYAPGEMVHVVQLLMAY